MKEGGAVSLMTSYNPVNGHWSASNYDLVTTILRREWGYTGIVMTDWWSTMNDPVCGGEADSRNTAAMVRAQDDLYMVVDNLRAGENPAGDNTMEALASGALTRGELQRCASNIFRFLMNAPVMERSLRKQTAEEKIPPLTDSELQCPRGTDKMSADFAGKEMTAKAPGTVKPVMGERVCFLAEQEGTYEITVRAHYDTEDSRAQSACNVFLNDILVATPQVNGTAGAVVERRMGTVELEAGWYELTLSDTLNPGIQVTEIELILKS